MKLIFCILVGLSTSNAFALKMQCNTLNVTPSEAGYYVDVNDEKGVKNPIATLSHVDKNAKNTFDPQDYAVSVIYQENRIAEVVGANFDMIFDSPWEAATDVTRGNYTLTAQLPNKTKVNIKTANPLFCHVLQN